MKKQENEEVKKAKEENEAAEEWTQYNPEQPPFNTVLELRVLLIGDM